MVLLSSITFELYTVSITASSPSGNEVTKFWRCFCKVIKKSLMGCECLMKVRKPKILLTSRWPKSHLSRYVYSFEIIHCNGSNEERVTVDLDNSIRNLNV